MKKIFAVLAASVLLLSGCAVQRPPELTAVKETLYKYHDSGAYDRDLKQLFEQACAYIDQHPLVKNPAVVLDIDETSLSNWDELKANELNFIVAGPCDHLPAGPCGLNAYHQKAISPALPQALDFYHKAKQKHIAVFFVTGRREFLRKSTDKNLRNVGFTDFAGLYLRPVSDRGASAIPYKSTTRKKIEDQGYTIIATIGDQKGDLAGGHAGKTFLLPNPFYTLK